MKLRQITRRAGREPLNALAIDSRTSLVSLDFVPRGFEGRRSIDLIHQTEPLASYRNFSHPTSCLPSLEAVLLAAPLTAQKRHRYYEGSDSRRPHPSDGSLRLLRFAFPQANAVHHQGRHSEPNHAIRPIVALSVASAPSVIQGFALIQQARHGF